MKFGKVRINASVMIALLAALYILMVCREKYFIEYAEGEPAPEELVAEEGGEVLETAEAVAAPIETAETTEAVETVEAVAAPKEEGMSPMTIAGIAMGSIFGLILIVFMLRAFRMRRYR
jgi:hypothetical protein